MDKGRTFSQKKEPNCDKVHAHKFCNRNFWWVLARKLESQNIIELFCNVNIIKRIINFTRYMNKTYRYKVKMIQFTKTTNLIMIEKGEGFFSHLQKLRFRCAFVIFLCVKKEKYDKNASKTVSRYFNLPNHSKQHMTVCNLFLHQGSTESRKTLEQK